MTLGSETFTAQQIVSFRMLSNVTGACLFLCIFDACLSFFLSFFLSLRVSDAIPSSGWNSKHLMAVIFIYYYYYLFIFLNVRLSENVDKSLPRLHPPLRAGRGGAGGDIFHAIESVRKIGRF